VGHLDTVLVLVVLNEGKSVFEGLSVEKGVQSVLRGAQDASGTSHTRVLLLGQVLVELSGGELLITNFLLVLSCDEFGSELFNVRLSTARKG